MKNMYDMEALENGRMKGKGQFKIYLSCVKCHSRMRRIKLKNHRCAK